MAFQLCREVMQRSLSPAFGFSPPSAFCSKIVKGCSLSKCRRKFTDQDVVLIV